MDYLPKIPRAEKAAIARRIAQRLLQRQVDGPDEPALDIFISETSRIADRLDVHVTGKTLASAARATRLAQRDAWDEKVDTWFRHIESFVFVEGHRRNIPHAAEALALHQAAFPDGLAHLDEPVPQQNVHCRASLRVLRAPEHAATITAIGLPVVWIDYFEAALTASDAAQEELVNARTETHVHVGLGRDVEVDWLDTMRRLRRLIGTRGRRGGALKEAEGMQLLEPLLVVMQKLHIEHTTRTTRKAKVKKDVAPAPPGQGAPTAPPAPAAP